MPNNDDVYLITGGVGGMGVAAARALAGRGRVLLADLEPERLAEVADELRSDGVAVDVQTCDVTVPADVEAVASHLAQMGRFAGLIHTAGLSPEMADGRRVLEVDLLGSIRVTAAVLPLVGPGSSAVLIASIAGHAPVPPEVQPLLQAPDLESFVDDVDAALLGRLDGATGYVIAKRGVILLAERLAAPWGARGGRVVSISPGLIDTPMGRMELERQAVMAGMASATPIQRPGAALPGRPEDIAAVAAFLSSAGASFVSGCDIRVDGGLMGAMASGPPL